MKDIERYKDSFDWFSERNMIRWSVNRIDYDERRNLYGHTVAVKGDGETIFSRIHISKSELSQFSPEEIARENLFRHKEAICDTICQLIDEPFQAFIRPDI